MVNDPITLATRAPPSRWIGINRRISIVIAFSSIGIAACCCNLPQQNAPAASLPTTPEGFIARFGVPDDDGSGENEVPRPLIPIRSIIYKKEKVEIFFHPDNQEVPVRLPVTGWHLIQCQDHTTNKTLSDEEVISRMAGRDSEKTAPAKAAKPEKGKTTAAPAPEKTKGET